MKNEYKMAEDYVNIKTVPNDWIGYENPSVEVTLLGGKYDEDQKIMLIRVIADALIRFSSLSSIPFIQEVKHNKL